MEVDKIFNEVIRLDPTDDKIKELRINNHYYELFCKRLLIYPIRVADRYLKPVFGCDVVIDDTVDGYELIIKGDKPEPIRYGVSGILVKVKEIKYKFWGF